MPIVDHSLARHLLRRKAIVVLCAITVLFLVAVAPAYSAGPVDVKRLASELQRLDPSLDLDEAKNDLIILDDVLTDHILPSLAPAQVLNDANMLRIPSDMLKISQLLLLRRMMYTGTLCLLVTNRQGNTQWLLVAIRHPHDGITKILDRVVVFRGTADRLRRMNDVFTPQTQKHLVSFEQIEASLKNPASIAAAEQMIAFSKSTTIAEIGGFMTIEHRQNTPPLLHFYVVKTMGEEFLARFEAAADDWERIVTLMRENPAEFAIVAHQYRSTLKTIELDLPQDKKREKVLAFADLFRYISRYSYYPDVFRYVTILGDENVQGWYVGDFHVHPDNNDVSYEDKANSADQRVIVLIPRGDQGFDIADLYKVAPTSRPTHIARYRRGGTDQSAE